MTKLFYFAGSENSNRIIKKLSQKIPDCELVKITEETSCRLEEDDIVGVAIPVDYLGLPEAVNLFLQNLQVSDTSYLFVFVIRGVLGRCVKKQILKQHPRLSYFQYVILGESINIDFWKYATAKDKEVRNRQCDDKLDKIARSIQNGYAKKNYKLLDLSWFYRLFLIRCYY